MNTESASNQIIVADKKWKYYVYASVCWGLVLAGFLTFNAKARHWQFWMAEVVMLSFALGLTYMLLNKKYKFVGRNSPEMDEYLKNKYADFLKVEGNFSYIQDGFIFHAENEELEVKWADITRISGHLEDVVSNDEDLCIKIEYSNGRFLEFDEEVPGWLLFRHNMRERFGFGPEWQERLLDSGAREIEIYKRPT